MAEQSNFLEVTRLPAPFLANNPEKAGLGNRKDYKIVFLEKGNLGLIIGEEELQIKGPSLYFLAPGQYSQMLQFSDDTTGICLTFDTDYFLLCLKNQVKLAFYPFFQIDQHPVLPVAKSQWERFRNLVGKIDYEYRNRKEINDNLLAKLHLNVLLIEIERLYKHTLQGAQPPTSRKKMITSKFKQLVEGNFLSLRRVSEYAEAMFMAPNYLNDVVRATTGQSASQVINDRIILEAKAKLIQTESSVHEIAYQLEFKDVSYFCRFFKKQTGLSPLVYRRTHYV